MNKVHKKLNIILYVHLRSVQIRNHQTQSYTYIISSSLRTYKFNHHLFHMDLFEYIIRMYKVHKNSISFSMSIYFIWSSLSTLYGCITYIKNSLSFSMSIYVENSKWLKWSFDFELYVRIYFIVTNYDMVTLAYIIRMYNVHKYLHTYLMWDPFPTLYRCIMYVTVSIHVSQLISAFTLKRDKTHAIYLGSYNYNTLHRILRTCTQGSLLVKICAGFAQAHITIKE